jgi:hypothetical protein
VHARKIIRDFLDKYCSKIHAKRRESLALLAHAGLTCELTLVGMARSLPPVIGIRHRIKRCDRLLGNTRLFRELWLIYAALAHRFIGAQTKPVIIVDWSDPLAACRSSGSRAGHAVV